MQTFHLQGWGYSERIHPAPSRCCPSLAWLALRAPVLSVRQQLGSCRPWEDSPQDPHNAMASTFPSPSPLILQVQSLHECMAGSQATVGQGNPLVTHHSVCVRKFL